MEGRREKGGEGGVKTRERVLIGCERRGGRERVGMQTRVQCEHSD